MDMILAKPDGQEICVVDYDFDLDLGATNDFQVNASYASWNPDIKIGDLIYIPGTEFGGIIKNITSATNTGNIYLKGYTWRGYLSKRFIRPPSGADYYIANGDLNDIIRALVIIPGFVVPTVATGINVNYQFSRYCSVLDGLESMLRTVGYRLDIRYVQTETGGYVQVQAVKAGLYGESVEYSQDSMIDFNSIDNQMGANHLICLGTGELKERLVVDLYADRAGNISQTQSIYGIDEIIDVFENSGAERETLIETGTNRFEELLSSKSFTVNIKQTGDELYIGDIVTGQDYITGNKVTKPIINKIVKRTNGVISRSYKIEGEK
mgnify:CR=1 FL=1